MTLFFLFAFTLLLLFAIHWGRLWKYRWTIKNYSFVFFVISYIFIPILFWIQIELYGKPQTSYIYDTSYTVHLLAFLIILISTILFYIIKPPILATRTIKEKQLKIFLTCLLTISTISTILFIQGQGGIENAWFNTMSIRSGSFIDEYGKQSFLFYKRFIPLSILVYFAYYAIQKNKLDVTFQLLSLFLSLLYLLCLEGSRQALFDFVAIHFIVELINKNKAFNKKIIILGLIGYFVLPFLKFYLSGGFMHEGLNANLTGDGFSVFDEFSFAYISLTNSIKYNGDFHFFVDLYADIFGTLLPSSLKPPGIENLASLNTFLCTGNIGKSVPPGFLGQGYYSLGIIGVIIIIVSTITLFNLLISYCDSIRIKNPHFSYLYAYLILMSVAWIRTGLYRNIFFKPNFIFFLLIIFFCTSKKQNILK